MLFTLKKHSLVDGLYVVEIGCLMIYFEYVGYDSSEQSLIFERDGEIVTGRVIVDSDEQLREWKQAFDAMNIELEHLND
ncbi:hypothetical protein N9R79_09790 [Vibrio sp.]|nr:hypothetical protein [Vibrio sp.]